MAWCLWNLLSLGNRLPRAEVLKRVLRYVEALLKQIWISCSQEAVDNKKIVVQTSGGKHRVIGWEGHLSAHGTGRDVPYEI